MTKLFSRKVIAVLLAVLLLAGTVSLTSASSVTSGVTDDGFSYWIENGEATVYSYSGGETEIAIPETVEGIVVTKIDSGFLTDSSNVEVIKIPADVADIHLGAFFESKKLKTINVSADNHTYCSVDGVLYNKDCTALLFYPCAKEGTEFTVLDTVTSIGENAFRDNDCLETVDLGDNITEIGNCAFYQSRIKKLELPNKLKSIGDKAFAYMRITSLDLPEGLVYIGSEILSHCNYFVSITIPASVAEISEGVFYGCSKLSQISVRYSSESYTAIDNVLYTKDMKTLIAYPTAKTTAEYTIPEGVEVIGKYAFGNCESVEKVYLPDTLKEIRCGAFSYCTQLQNVEIPQGVTLIGEEAFMSCYCFTDIVIPDSVTTIGDFAFLECYEMKSVTIPDGVSEIGKLALECYSDNLVVYGYEASYAEKYCADNKITFEYLIKETEPTESTTATPDTVPTETTVPTEPDCSTETTEVTVLTDPTEIITTTEASSETASTDPTESTCQEETTLSADIPEVTVQTDATESTLQTETSTVEVTQTETTEPSFTSAPVTDNTEQTETTEITSESTQTTTVTELTETTITDITESTETTEDTTAEPEPSYDLGDVNLDGKVNIKDATAIQKHIASLEQLSEYALTFADVDSDGNVNIKDATAIQKHIAGLAPLPQINEKRDETDDV